MIENVSTSRRKYFTRFSRWFTTLSWDFRDWEKQTFISIESRWRDLMRSNSIELFSILSRSFWLEKIKRRLYMFWSVIKKSFWTYKSHKYDLTDQENDEKKRKRMTRWRHVIVVVARARRDRREIDKRCQHDRSEKKAQRRREDNERSTCENDTNSRTLWTQSKENDERSWSIDQDSASHVYRRRSLDAQVDIDN